MTAQSPYRPVGYFLWGFAWLIIVVSILALPVMVIIGAMNGQLQSAGEPVNLAGSAITWVIGVPLCAWLFFMFPFTMLSQTALSFVAMVLSTRAEYREVKLTKMVGSARYKTLDPLIDIPAFRVVAAVSKLGTQPGWLFAISSMAITAGIGLVLASFGMTPTIAGAVLVVGGAIGSAIGIRNRVNIEAKKPAVEPETPSRLTEKYYKGLRYRENKRARDLKKARDAGRAGTEPGATERWGIAEAKHALREHNMSANHARKGVPGALDAAFDMVFDNMQGAVTRAQAEQFVIDEAAFRGKKPVPVAADDTVDEWQPPTTR